VAAAGAHAAQDRLLAALVVAFAVDHRQPADGRLPGQVGGFDVELVVVVGPGLVAELGVAAVEVMNCSVVCH
jgi:hypothetical protein